MPRRGKILIAPGETGGWKNRMFERTPEGFNVSFE
jgi:hypothetical protein